MLSVHDVAAYILEKEKHTGAMKLHKLLYYCQAWHLVYRDEPLFDEKIEAWRDGPVVREVYDLHKGKFALREWDVGDGEELGKSERTLVDAVLKVYGKMSGQQLSDRTHAEAPWTNARLGYAPNERSDEEISLHDMYQYYGARVGKS